MKKPECPIILLTSLWYFGLAMRPSYSISVDHDRSLLRLVPWGFFDMETVWRFIAERDAAVDSMHCGRNQHVTLCDIREQMLSTQEVADAFAAMVADPHYASRRLAFVVNGALSAMQTRRIVRRDHVEYFADVFSAEEWLMAP